MQAMTPEQNERWKAAINVLDYLDFHATTQKGIEESTERLAALDVPGWATRTRASLLGWHIKNPNIEALWLSEFALRSECALAGIAVLYPTRTESVIVYRRVLLHFLQYAFLPYVGWPEIRALRQLCAGPEESRKVWMDLRRKTGGQSLSIHVETNASLPVQQCVALTILLNELVANSIQHGSGNIIVTLKSAPCPQGSAAKLLCLEVSDEGQGFPTNFDLRSHTKLGLELVEALCCWDLNGKLVLQNQPTGGAIASVCFPTISP